MAAFPPDLSDCVDNRLPFWSGEMLKQLKTLINTPGKTYADLMADPSWPVYIHNFGSNMVKGQKVSKYHAEQAMKEMGKKNGWRKKQFSGVSPGSTNPKEMNKAELLALVEKLTTKIAQLETADDDGAGSGDDAPAEEHKDT